MPAPSDPRQTLAGAIAADLCDALEQLLQLLQTELDTLLQHHDASRIEQLAARKSELCARIDALQQRSAPEVPDAPRLRDLAREVAQANQRNGAVLAALIRNTQGALNVLRGAAGADRGEVYGPRGRSVAAGTAKPLGSA